MNHIILHTFDYKDKYYVRIQYVDDDNCDSASDTLAKQYSGNIYTMYYKSRFTQDIHDRVIAYTKLMYHAKVLVDNEEQGVLFETPKPVLISEVQTLVDRFLEETDTFDIETFISSQPAPMDSYIKYNVAKTPMIETTNYEEVLMQARNTCPFATNITFELMRTHASHVSHVSPSGTLHGYIAPMCVLGYMFMVALAQLSYGDIKQVDKLLKNSRLPSWCSLQESLSFNAVEITTTVGEVLMLLKEWCLPPCTDLSDYLHRLHKHVSNRRDNICEHDPYAVLQVPIADETDMSIWHPSQIDDAKDPKLVNNTGTRQHPTWDLRGHLCDNVPHAPPEGDSKNAWWRQPFIHPWPLANKDTGLHENTTTLCLIYNCVTEEYKRGLNLNDWMLECTEVCSETGPQGNMTQLSEQLDTVENQVNTLLQTMDVGQKTIFKRFMHHILSSDEPEAKPVGHKFMGTKCDCALCVAPTIKEVEQHALIKHFLVHANLKQEDHAWCMSKQITNQIEAFINGVNDGIKDTGLHCKINRNTISQSLEEFIEKRRKVAGMTFMCKSPDNELVANVTNTTTNLIKVKSTAAS